MQKRKKMSSDLFKNVINKMYLQIIYIQYVYKQDLALNNLQWLICHKMKTNSNQMVQEILLGLQ